MADRGCAPNRWEQDGGSRAGLHYTHATADHSHLLRPPTTLQRLPLLADERRPASTVFSHASGFAVRNRTRLLGAGAVSQGIAVHPRDLRQAARPAQVCDERRRVGRCDAVALTTRAGVTYAPLRDSASAVRRLRLWRSRRSPLPRAKMATVDIVTAIEMRCVVACP